MSTALEEVTAKAYHSEALEGVRTEHAKYFEVLEQHPRLLIGQEVPKIGGAAGEMETLRDASDAAEWQEAVKTVLVEEVRDRASRAMEDNSGFLTTLHQSIELFQNNNDLVPGTKEFDVELADKFATLMQPYEVRVEDKFQGYSIPVQPIINQLRTDLTAARAANPAAAEVVPDKDKPVTKQDEPQAGLQSKAGSDADTEDFSTLFGTLGLPNLRI